MFLLYCKLPNVVGQAHLVSLDPSLASMALLECERPKVVRRNAQNSGFKGQNSPDFADVIFVSFNMKLFILKFRDEKGDIVAAATDSHFLHLCNGSWNAVSSPIVWHWPKSMLLYLTSTTLCIHNLSLSLLSHYFCHSYYYQDITVVTTVIAYCHCYYHYYFFLLFGAISASTSSNNFP